jgi:hypothetical protein
MEFTWNQMFGSDTRYDAEQIAPDKDRIARYFIRTEHTTGSLRGSRTNAVRSTRSGRPSVTLRKNRSVETV